MSIEYGRGDASRLLELFLGHTLYINNYLLDNRIGLLLDDRLKETFLKLLKECPLFYFHVYRLSVCGGLHRHIF